MNQPTTVPADTRSTFAVTVAKVSHRDVILSTTSARIVVPAGRTVAQVVAGIFGKFAVIMSVEAA
jgi:hypothetical protein